MLKIGVVLLIFWGNSSASASPLGRLNWGKVPNHSTSCKLQIETTESLRARILKSAKADHLAALAKNDFHRAETLLPETLATLASIHISKLHSEDPLYQKTVLATSGLHKLLILSFCARLAGAPLALKCEGKAKAAIADWVKTYSPTGQPIDEANFVFLFESIDLMRDLLDAKAWGETASWMRSFIQKSDAFFSSEMKGHDPANKNWNTWRMAIRATAAVTLDDAIEIKKSAELIHEQATANIIKSSGAVQDGTTTDFLKRDALHYHLYDLEAWVLIADLTPCLLSADDHAAIASAFEFAKPYFLGLKQHIEFVHSQIPEDKERADAGDKTYQPHVWKAEDDVMNRTVIRYARPAFPNVRDWTANYVDSEYDAGLKFSAKLFGEPLDSR